MTLINTQHTLPKCISAPSTSSPSVASTSFIVSTSSTSSPCIAGRSKHRKKSKSSSSVRRENINAISTVIQQIYPHHYESYSRQLQSMSVSKTPRPRRKSHYQSKKTDDIPCKIAFNGEFKSFRVLSPPFAKGGEKSIYLAVEIKTQKLFTVAISKIEGVRDAKKHLDFQAKLKLSHVVQYLDSAFYTGKKGTLKKIVWMEHFITDLCVQSVEKESSPVKMNLFSIATQAVTAIQQLHEKGIEHGDIKPENFLLNHKSLKVTDLDNSNFAFRVKNSLDLFLTGDYCSPELMIKERIIKKIDQLRIHANNASAEARILAEGVTLMEQIELLPEEKDEVARNKQTIIELDEEAKNYLKTAVDCENTAKNLTVLFANDIFALALTLFIAKYQYNPMQNYFYYELGLNLKQCQFPPLKYLDEKTWSSVLEYAFETPPEPDSYDALLMEMMAFDPNKRPRIATCLEKLHVAHAKDPSSFEFKPLDREDSVSEDLMA